MSWSWETGDNSGPSLQAFIPLRPGSQHPFKFSKTWWRAWSCQVVRLGSRKSLDTALATPLGAESSLKLLPLVHTSFAILTHVTFITKLNRKHHKQNTTACRFLFHVHFPIKASAIYYSFHRLPPKACLHLFILVRIMLFWSNTCLVSHCYSLYQISLTRLHIWKLFIQLKNVIRNYTSLWLRMQCKL